MPLAFIDVLVAVDHTPLTLGMSVDPVSVVAIAIGVEECAASVAAVFVPVASVLAAQLPTVISPEGALAVLLIHRPHSLVLIAVFVVLDAEALLAVVSPVADVARRALPLLTLHGTIFLVVLLLDPVN